MDDADIAAMFEQSLLDRRPTFTWGDLLHAVAERLPEASDSHVERVAEGIADGPAVVELRSADPATEPEYSTPAALAAMQRRAVDRATDRRDAGLGVAGEHELAEVLARRPELQPGHVAAIGDVATSGRAVDVLLYRDRDDKLAVVEAAGAAWQRWGPRVLAAAPDADAAARLERDTNLATVPVDELLVDVEFPRHGGGGLPRGCVLLVDDANLLPDHTLSRLLDAAARDETKVVLVADARLSASDGPGDAFRAIAAAAGPTLARLDERAPSARDTPRQGGDVPPYQRRNLAALTAERTWLLRRIAREETRLGELQEGRTALPAWQRASRRDLTERITIAQDSLGAARARLADLDDDIASITAPRPTTRTAPGRSAGITGDEHPSRDRDGADGRRHERIRRDSAGRG